MKKPDLYYQNNVCGTLNLLNAMKDAEITNIVFSSTCSTYGIPIRVPIHENDPQSPINPYGASKLMIERILQDYNIAYGLNSISLRYFNAAGADPKSEIGERHLPETHLIPITLRAAYDEESEITVFGADYDTPDGTCVRDYVHVSDLADAHVRAIDYLTDGGSSESCNLGLGQGFSVTEVIDSVQRVTGRLIVGVAVPRRVGDPPILASDAHRAQKVLGWEPKYRDLDSIIRTAWRWHQKDWNGNG